jgi:hypothetical protein
VLVHDGDRASEVQGLGLGEHAIEEGEHLGVRVGATTEEDHAGPVCLEQGEEARVVEIGGDDDAVFGPYSLEDFAVRLGAESDGGGVHGVVALGCEVCYCLWSHRHVDQELQPASSTVSSSARLAA